MAPFSLRQVGDNTATTFGGETPARDDGVDDDDDDDPASLAEDDDDEDDDDVGVSPMTTMVPSEVPTQIDGVKKESPLRTKVSANSMTEMDS